MGDQVPAYETVFHSFYQHVDIIVYGWRAANGVGASLFFATTILKKSEELAWLIVNGLSVFLL